MAWTRHNRPAATTVGRRVGIWAFLVVGATLVPARWLEAGPEPAAAPDHPGGFAAQVAAHFAGWDLDRDGALSFLELGRLVPDVRIQGEAAAALAAIHRIQRGKNPAWHHAAFTRDDLVGEDTGTGTGPRPPFERNYRQGLARLRTTRRELFVPGAPAWAVFIRVRWATAICWPPWGQPSTATRRRSAHDRPAARRHVPGPLPRWANGPGLVRLRHGGPAGVE